MYKNAAAPIALSDQNIRDQNASGDKVRKLLQSLDGWALAPDDIRCQTAPAYATTGSRSPGMADLLRLKSHRVENLACSQYSLQVL